MAIQMQSLSSSTSSFSVLFVMFYFVGFIRVELEMTKQKERISALENAAEAKPKLNDADVKIINNAPGKLVFRKHSR